MSPYLSHILAELRQSLLTRRGATHAPKDVARGVHKVYPRMPQIALPKPQQLTQSVNEAISQRTSYSGGSDEKTLTLEELGTLLGTALGKHADSQRRHYPSGGALYPIETYLLTNTFEDVSILHYNPTAHALENLWTPPDGYDLKDVTRTPNNLLFSTMIIFSSVWARSSAKYGDLAFLHALIEAGHMSQNVLLVATALGLQSRPYAGFDDEELTKLLDLDIEQEQVIHTILLSR